MNSDPGYVYVPYIIKDVVENYKRKKRVDKINSIFDLDLKIETEVFIPKKSISSRYSIGSINKKYYEVINTQK